MEQLINDYGQLVIGAVGVLLLFFAGNKEKAWEALKGLLEYFPGQKPVEPKPVDAPVNLEPLPPISGDSSSKVNWYMVRDRLKDGIGWDDVVWFAKIMWYLLPFIAPFLMQLAEEKISQQEQKKQVK